MNDQKEKEEYVKSFRPFGLFRAFYDYRRQLSILEIVIFSLILFYIFMNDTQNPYVSEFTEIKFSDFIRWVFTPRDGLVYFSILIMEILCFILFDRSIFVGYISLASITVIKKHIDSENLQKLNYPNDLNKTEKTNKKYYEETEFAVGKIKNPELYFLSLVKRAEVASSSAQRRAIALIFIGTLVAGSGLVFFVATLPVEYSGEVSQKLFYIIPRVLMLLFIQVLAGFFLKQYRNSMEEYRFYESLLRRRESQMMAYLVYKENPDEKLRENFLDLIKNEKELEKLTQGETTISIETQKNSSNDLSTLVDKIIDAFKQQTTTQENKK